LGGVETSTEDNVDVRKLYRFGRHQLIPGERTLLRDGQPVPLTPKVFDLLCYLAAHHGHALSKDEIMKAIWKDTVVEEANLSQNISVLRKALGQGDETDHIETVARYGYRFVAPLAPDPEQPDEEPAESMQAREMTPR
jgi:DNA-binding winged helix-turn-helix (wHTH) protein